MLYLLSSFFKVVDYLIFLRMSTQEYNEDSIRSLDWKEHIRLRPGMYIGKMGNEIGRAHV